MTYDFPALLLKNQYKIPKLVHTDVNSLGKHYWQTDNVCISKDHLQFLNINVTIPLQLYSIRENGLHLINLLSDE